MYGSAARLEDAYIDDLKLDLWVPVANFSSGRISVNSLGFRGPEIAMPKPAGTVRIAFLGASTTWSSEVSGNDFVWPHLVAASLSKTFPGTRFDYVNGGVSGYTIQLIQKNLQYRVAPLQPDVYDHQNEIIREVASKAGALLIEGEQEIPGDATHFADSIHFTDVGSQVMAERISRALSGSSALRQIADSARGK